MMMRLLICVAIVAATMSTPVSALSLKTVYSLYFPSNRADVVDDGLRILEQAADRLRKDFYVRRVEITGHTDRVGPRWYNHQLSEQRAIVARNVLVALGVRDDLIRIRAKGEDAPLVPTADDVNEPQNRRVEIKLIYGK
jgi:OOP family OmpA-OmpF porin